jgi:hypothetical protein
MNKVKTWEISGDLNTDSETLYELSFAKSWEIRERVAANPNTPIHAISQLRYDDYDDVIRAVHGNPKFRKLLSLRDRDYEVLLMASKYLKIY